MIACPWVNARKMRRSAQVLTVCRRQGITGFMLIYKIFRANEWQTLRSAGTTQGAPIDVADGYVHFSTATQAAETAAKHFAGEDDLFLLAVETDRLGDAIKWEVSRGGAKFPHLYRDLQLTDIAWAQPLPLHDGAHQFPAGFETA
ncbi:MAG: hypothetical protein ACJAWM_001377 [Sulfitobacter sp.]|jgi:uncharacterized protein (DUF952 family)